MNLRLKRQQGAALFISLIILVLLTILGLSSIRSTILQEKMAGNYKNKSKSFQAAESALRAGEAWLESKSDLPSVDSSNLYADNTVQATTKSWWWGSDGQEGGSGDNADKGVALSLSGVGMNPRYAIEQEAFAPDSLNVGSGVPTGTYVHRVISFGIGGNDTAPSVLESRFMKRYN